MIHLQMKIKDAIYVYGRYPVMLIALIPLTLSCLPSLLSITLGGSFRRHLVLAQSWLIWVFASQLSLVCPQENITIQFMPTFLIVPSMSCSFYVDGL